MSSVSQILRQTRESKGITLEEVAQRTYIKLPYLNALENGDVEKLPAPVYIHGYIRQYAKLLGLNGSELVLQYQQDASRPAASKLVLSPGNRVSAAIAELNQPSEELKPLPSVERAPLPAVERRAPAMDLSEPTPSRATDMLPSRVEPTVFAEPPVREQLVPVAETSLREPGHVEASVPSAHDVLMAKQQAHQILSSAQREAQEMRIAAERYADQVLAQLENEINRSLQTVRNGRAFLQSRRRKLQEG